MNISISSLILALCVGACYKLADKKGYNKYIAIVVGALTGIIGIIIYACLKNKKI